MSEERANTHQVCYALEQRLQAACHQEQELTLSSQDGAQTLTAWRLDLESHVLRAPHPSHLQAAVPGKHTACPDCSRHLPSEQKLHMPSNHHDSLGQERYQA